MSNDKAAATYHPDPPPAPPIEPAEDDLPPLSILVEMLSESIAQLQGVEDLLIAHRRKAGDDHYQLGRLQDAQARTSDAISAAVSAWKRLRSRS